mgnify:CR=1 FL=1
MNLETKIIKESLVVLILVSIISALGGIGIQIVKEKIFMILPLLILFPALNGMVGNFGAIFASRYTTLLYQKKLGRKKFMNKALKEVYFQVLKVSIIAAFYISTLSSVVSMIKGFEFDPLLYMKILIVTVLTTVFLVTIISLVSISAGGYFANKKEDPDNLLIPITTAIADFGTMIIFSLLVFFVL